MVEWIVTPNKDNPQKATLAGPTGQYVCAAGKKGFIDEAKAREGDQATPAGTYPLRQVFYRSDKISALKTALKHTAIKPDMGWCDDPSHPMYNKLVSLPFAASHEKLWRDDDVYDLIIVIGHNDDPVIPGKGSAIFLHVARDDMRPTMGCLAFEKKQLIHLIAQLTQSDILTIRL